MSAASVISGDRKKAFLREGWTKKKEKCRKDVDKKGKYIDRRKEKHVII